MECRNCKTSLDDVGPAKTFDLTMSWGASWTVYSCADEQCLSSMTQVFEKSACPACPGTATEGHVWCSWGHAWGNRREATWPQNKPEWQKTLADRIALADRLLGLNGW